MNDKPTWTKTPPTEPGWYWMFDGRIMIIHKVISHEIESGTWEGWNNLY